MICIHLPPYSFGKLLEGNPFTVNVARVHLKGLSVALGSGLYGALQGEPVTFQCGEKTCQARVTALSNRPRQPLSITVIHTPEAVPVNEVPPGKAATFLFLPAESDPQRLLAPGVLVACKAHTTSREGVVLNGWHYGWQTDGGMYVRNVGLLLGLQEHLVLARDGAEVYEGTDRLRRVLAAHVGVATNTGGVVFHGAHGDGLRDRRSTEWAIHPWSSVDAVQFYGDPKEAWSGELHPTIHVPALATPPWPAKPRHPLYTTWALAQAAQSQGLGTLVVLDTEGP